MSVDWSSAVCSSVLGFFFFFAVLPADRGLATDSKSCGIAGGLKKSINKAVFALRDPLNVDFYALCREKILLAGAEL